MSLFLAPYLKKMMIKNLFYTILFATLLIPNLTFGQPFNYDFVPKTLRLLSDEEANLAQIVITPDVLLYTEKGQLLPMSEMRLMANPEYKPLFYTDETQKIKTVVFQKKSNHPVLIEKNPEANYTKGEKAYDFIATDLDGNTIKLSHLKGKIVVLNFWFTKCTPCVLEMPQLNQLVKEYSPENVIFLALTFDKNQTIQNFLQQQAFNYKILSNANAIITMYGVQTYPTNIIINQKGEIVFKELGYRTNIKAIIKKEIDNLL